ncbi:Protein ELYS [Lamellibrachia satsuma]|nr:Protein ELYS [Lamellibrachia satsuma]
MRKQSPNWTSALAPFCPATLDCLGRNEALDDSFVLGGTSQDGNIGWLARGNALEVFSGTSGERLAAWCFGNILREPSTCITCVCTYDCDGGCKMIIATSSETSRAGMLCLFCIKTSKVIRAIEVPCKVTALELICVTGQTRDMPTLGEQLKSFCGILAVGTDGGHTFLLDMCLDDESVDGGELQLNEMCFISPRTSDIASVRYVAQSRRQNLALELGEDTQTKGWYLYRRPDSSVVKKYNAGHVTISCLKYMPQTGMLAIGFNFGCFQLWRLNVPVLEYSSRFEDDLAPVSTFAYQEPENDPRYFCYLWVGRGPLPHHDTDEYASTVMLFQMEFDKKTWYDSLGHVFEELTSVGPRFQHELTGDVKSPVEGSSGQNFGSRIIACSNLIDPRSMTNKGSDDQSFDDGGPSSLRLCMFAWEVQTLAPQSQHSCVLGVFDMNRWYHAQMPVSISVGASHEECPFFAFCSLDDVLAASNSEAVVTAHIPHLSITKFSPYVFGISESGIVRAKFLGIQRQILADMLHGGTAVLIDPTEMYNRCLSAALLPRHMERSSIAVSLIDKREAVLSVALHHNLIGFITGCITQSASSSDYVGTLRLVVEWAWRTVTKIKESLDTICEPLHDWSGLQLDLESVQKLHHHNVALVHLVTIFQMLATHSATTTEQAEIGEEGGSKTCKTEKAGLLRMYQTFGVKLLTFKLRHSNDCRALIGLAVSRERLISHPGIFAYA